MCCRPGATKSQTQLSDWTTGHPASSLVDKWPHCSPTPSPDAPGHPAHGCCWPLREQWHSASVGRPLLPTALLPLPSLGQAPCTGSGPHSSLPPVLHRHSPQISSTSAPHLVFQMDQVQGITPSPGPCDVQVARSPSCSDGCPSHLQELTAPCEALVSSWCVTAELRAG